MSDSASDLETARSGRRRVAPVVALTVLEVIRDQDLPTELMEDEDPAVTMPRRLGLSDVIERQIRSYQKAVRRRRRISDEEVGNLFRLVVRRPDAEEVFLAVGRRLTDYDGSEVGSWRRVLPNRLAYALARRRLRRRLRSLFGRRIGGFGSGPYTLEGRALLFYQADPGGDACHLVTGLSESVARGVTGRDDRVDHTRCQALGDELCRWELVEDAAA